MTQQPSDLMNPKHSVVFDTLLAFVVIISVSVLSLLGNLYVADALNGDAAAINQAGSLRMQSYRIAVSLSSAEQPLLEEQIKGMNATLSGPVLQSTLRRHPDSPLSDNYQRVREHWQQTMLPLASQPDASAAPYIAQLDDFTAELEFFVHSLQQASESKLGVIRILHISTLFIIVIIAFVLIYRLHNNLAGPLRGLTAMARKVGQGDFNARMQVTGDTELSLLGHTLNQTSAELAELYSHMENKVSEKTAALRRSNETLQLLFNSAQMLYRQPKDPQQLMGHMLGKVQQILHSGPVSLCLNREQSSDSYVAMTSIDLLQPAYCRLPDCEQCPAHTTAGTLPNGGHLISFALDSGQAHLGNLRVELASGAQLEGWQSQLMTTLADLFAASLSLNQLGEKQARLALMEERTIIARELHDSLAQALSAQKLQLARLKRQATQGSDSLTLNATINEIEAGTNAAYRQLRELLTTFRIKLDQPGLKPALMATVKEFSSNSGVIIELDFPLEHCPLSPNEEIHCLQVTREALSNVIKHARASHCRVSFSQDSQGTIHLRIEDDGVGIQVEDSPTGHYGLSILRERADSLQGNISIARGKTRGTCVSMDFTPDYKRIHLHEEQPSHG